MIYFLKNLKIQTKLIMLIGLVLAGFVIDEIGAVWTVSTVRKHHEHIIELRQDIKDIAVLNSDLNEIRTLLLTLINESEPDKMKMYKNDIGELNKHLENVFSVLLNQPISSDIKEHLQAAYKAYSEFRDTRDKELLPFVFKDKRKEARALALGIQVKRYNIFKKESQAAVSMLQKNIDDAEKKFTISANRRLLLFSTLTVGLFFLVLGFAIFIIILITKPLHDLTESARKISLGELEQNPLKVLSGDEIGQLSDTFNHMRLDLMSQRAELETSKKKELEQVHKSQRATLNIMKDMNQLTKELSESKSYIENIIKSMTDALIVASPDGNILTVNQAALNLLGYNEKELLGKPAGILFVAEAAAAAEEEEEEETSPFKHTKLKRLLKEGYLKSFEINYKTKSGERIPMILSGSVMRDQKENLVGIVCSAKDVREVRKAQRRFEQAVQSAPNGMLMVNEEGAITLVNGATEKMFGYEKGELNGMSVETLVPHQFRKQHPDHRKGFFKNPKPRLMGEGRDLMGLKKDGTEFPVEIGLAPIETEEGLFVLSAIMDISIRKEAENKFKEAYEKLKEIDALKDEFVSMVSHEIRTPMTVIRAALENIRSGIVPKNKLERVYTMMTDNVDRLTSLINKVLDISKMEAGKMKYEFQNVSFNDLCKKIIETYKIKTDKKGVVLKKDVPSDLPFLYADQDKLEQVLINLVGNSIKFTSSGDQITICAKCDGTDFIKISVSDTGCGVSKADLPHLFEKFSQAKGKLKKVPGGTGLGLSIVSEIVKAHHGKIQVKSEEGKGTSFYFTVPVYKKDKAKAA